MNEIDIKTVTKMLGVGTNFVYTLAKKGKIKRVCAGHYDYASVVNYMAEKVKRENKTSNMLKDRKNRILNAINSSWRTHSASTSINEMSKKLKMSTSTVTRYVTRLIKSGEVTRYRNELYPKGLRVEISVTVANYFEEIENGKK